MQLTQTQLDAALGDMIATGGAFDPAATFVGVATAVNGQGLLTLMSDLTKATGAMATAVAVTAWSDVYHLGDGRSAVDGPLMTFAPANAGESQVLTAWYVGNLATSTVLYGYGAISPPAILTDEFHSWSIVLRLTLDPSGQWSAEVTFDG